MRRDHQFRLLHEHFGRVDMELIRKKGVSVFNTAYGLYGSSGMLDCFELFRKIGLENYRKFVDLGSGDGRIVLLASLFTHATGIEGDKELHDLAVRSREELHDRLPARSDFLNDDYTQTDLSGYDCIFIYADHDWPANFQEKLLSECKAVLLSRHNIYRPTMLKKGRTYHIGHVPFVSYHLNLEEKAL